MADEGAQALVRFEAAVEALRDRHVTVVSHSYGTSVAGRAFDHGLEVDDVIFMGSPGVGADHASEFAPARVWSAQTGDDWIDRVPNMDVFGFGHGTDPTDPDFGAMVFSARDSSGHSEYFEAGKESMTNVTRIVNGRFDEVLLCENVGCDGYP